MIVPCGAAFLIDKGENIENKREALTFAVMSLFTVFGVIISNHHMDIQNHQLL